MEPVRTATAAERWEGRPRLARALRVAVWLTPVLTSVAAVFVASRLVDRPPSPWAVGWWVAMMAWGTATLWSTDRLARRLLPLAALLQLSLVFPDSAPSRFGLALRRRARRSTGSAGWSGSPGWYGSSGWSDSSDAVGFPPDDVPDTPAGAAARLGALLADLSAHDRRTRGHAERVRAYAALLGRELGLDPDEADRLQWAALLHDIGKLGVPAALLNKPGELSAEEFELVKTHAAEGARLVEPLRWWLGEWTDAVGEHHEKWDGTGYPRGLRRHQISRAARIVAVADVFDVMTAARAYQRPRHAAAARAELTRCAGTHFDPQVVRAFLSISIGRLHRRIGPLAWLADIPILGSAGTAAGVAATAAVPPMAGSVVAAAVAALLVVPAPAGPEQPAGPDTELATAAPSSSARSTAAGTVGGGPPPAGPAATGTADPDAGAAASGTVGLPGPDGTPVPAPGTTTPRPVTATTTAPPPTPVASPPSTAGSTTTSAPGPPPTAASPTTAPPPTAPPSTAPPGTGPSTSASTTTAPGPSTTTTSALAPLVARSDSYEADHDGVTADLTENDSGGTPPGSLRVVLVRRDAGEVTADFSGADGTVTFRPDDGFAGTAAFTYWVRDAAGRHSSAVVTVTVD